MSAGDNMRVVQPPSDEHLLPVTVIGGDSGAGKSALVRHLLTHPEGHSLAFILDDCTPLELHANDIAYREGAFVTLANGCVCCTKDGDVPSALDTLRKRAERPSHVIIEANAAAHLRRVAGYAYMPGYRIDSIVVVADAQTIRHRVELVETSLRVRRQLESAEILVLNKVDLVPARARAVLRDWLTVILPNTHIIETEYGRVGSSLLFGVDPEDAERDALAVSTTWETTFRTPGRRAPVRRTEERVSGPSHRVWSLVTSDPISAHDFRAWTTHLPKSIVRGSGVVHISEDPLYRYHFDRVGHRSQVSRHLPWGQATPETRLALVGL
jgi:G3E family GTPase